MTAISVGGIAIIIVPLLSLTANQLERIRMAVQDYGVITAYNMDDASPSDIQNKILPKMKNFVYNSSTTMVLLSSPQFIADNVEFRDMLLRCRDNETLRTCAIDEVHMYAQHVNFRDSIRILRRDFFTKLYKGEQTYSPLFFCATATQPDLQIGGRWRQGFVGPQKLTYPHSRHKHTKNRYIGPTPPLHIRMFSTKTNYSDF
mmetsp:Transcript_10799/g.18926  ORF Transcript_10799/g.18926 Transcript_10799/m.18926 type:complete len:202 (-) Transcript_10799:178-783(-)